MIIKFTTWIVSIFVSFACVFAHAAAKSDPRADKLVAGSEENGMGKSLTATVSMKILRPGSERDLKFKLWQFKREKALVKVNEPVKDRGSGSLRIGQNLWQYLPNVGRTVRIPPSMMLQSWMGSDFTNDDMIKSSSLSRDYFHSIEKEETINGDKVSVVVCDPKPDAPVVWGKVKAWIRNKDYVNLKQEFYSEHGELLKVMVGTDIKKFGSHIIPTVSTMTVLKKPGNRTVMQFHDMIFDKAVEDRVFTQENLSRVGG